MPNATCCGMAGAFGFEADHYEISVKVGEHELLPSVRAADEDTLLVTDGFSCREQIEQLTGRRAVHLAEVLASASPRTREIYRNSLNPDRGSSRHSTVALLAAMGVAGGAMLLLSAP